MMIMMMTAFLAAFVTIHRIGGGESAVGVLIVPASGNIAWSIGWEPSWEVMVGGPATVADDPGGV